MRRQLSLFRGRFALVLAALVGMAALPARSETLLVMAEEVGCVWCALWNKEIAPIYPKTAEGRAAPLRRINIHEDPPSDIVLKSRLTFTPTFVLVSEGKEVSRIEGYPGEDFFWGLMGQMLKEAGIGYDQSG